MPSLSKRFKSILAGLAIASASIGAVIGAASIGSSARRNRVLDQLPEKYKTQIEQLQKEGKYSGKTLEDARNNIAFAYNDIKNAEEVYERLQKIKNPDFAHLSEPNYMRLHNEMRASLKMARARLTKFSLPEVFDVRELLVQIDTLENSLRLWEEKNK